MDNTESNSRKAAFTLIEVLVVISVIAILIALLLPAVQVARSTARKASCRNNLMQLGLAMHNYATAHGVLPPGVVEPTGPIRSKPPGYHFSWIVQVLPFLERRNIYHRFDFSVSVYDAQNRESRSMQIAVLACPSSGAGSAAPGEPGGTSYAGCHHDVEASIAVDQNGVLFLNSSVRLKDISDGAANTIYLGEKIPYGDDLGWASGTRSVLRNTGYTINGFDPAIFGTGDGSPGTGILQELAEGVDTAFVGSFGSPHTGGAFFLLGDGSVKFIHENINANILKRLGNRQDGEMMGEF